VSVRRDWRWGALAAILVAVPITLSAPRGTEFEASARLVPTANSAVGMRLESYVRRQLRSAHVRNNVVAASGFLADPRTLSERVRVEAADGSVLLWAHASTWSRARSLARGVGALIVGKSEGTIVPAGVSKPRPSRAFDRFVDRLPGDPPPRVNPLLASLAGLALAVLIWALAWHRRRGSRSGPPLGTPRRPPAR